jgi:hypothetical protein
MAQQELGMSKPHHRRLGRFASGERRLDVVEFVAVAKALKVDSVELFTRCMRAT